jgi:signal transduction histidine kinase/ActR/RegA family two-component response regulator
MAETTWPPPRALLVGGDAATGALFREALSRLGGSLTVAADGPAAAAVLAREVMDVVVVGPPPTGPRGPALLEPLRGLGAAPPLLVLLGGGSMNPGRDTLRKTIPAAPLRAEEVARLLDQLLADRRAAAGPPRADLEARRRSVQHLALVGQVAGGVAHDLNNLLAVLLGFSSYHLERLPAHDPLHESAREMHRAASQAALLVRRLLSVSGPPVARRPVPLNALLLDLEKMLTYLLRADIGLVLELEPSVGLVEAQPGRLEQVVLNLVLNARDAMPEGGRVTVRTRNRSVPAADPELPPGEYVTLTVSDTGVGMDAATRARAFEPFFTTKPPGQGTGLGLAIVAEVVAECHGLVRVQSEPGQGTTFAMHLPRLPEDSAGPAEPQPAPAEPPPSRATVLVVEDDASIRRLIETILRTQGYTLLLASRGAEALELCRQHPGRIDLLIADLWLPQMSGRDVARAVAALHPGVKVLFVSGLAEADAEPAEAIAEGGNFLAKPFGPDDLLQKVRALRGGQEGC